MRAQEARTDADRAKAPGAAGPGQLEALWQTVAEGDLFQSASHERKHLGFQLFSILLPHLRSAARAPRCPSQTCSGAVAPVMYLVLARTLHYAYLPCRTLNSLPTPPTALQLMLSAFGCGKAFRFAAQQQQPTALSPAARHGLMDAARMSRTHHLQPCLASHAQDVQR